MKIDELENPSNRRHFSLVRLIGFLSSSSYIIVSSLLVELSIVPG